MKKFIKEILSVVSILFIINIGIYYSITKDLLFSNYEAPLREKMERFGTFIFADSHGWSLTNGHPEISKSLEKIGIKNLSFGSDSYQDILAKFSWLIKNASSIDTIIISIDDHMLTKKSNNRNRTISFINPPAFSKVYGEPTPKYFYYLVVRYLPVLYPSNQALIKNYLVSKFYKDKNEVRALPWQDQPEIERIERAKEKVHSFYPGGQFHPKPALKKALRKILSIAEENGITVIGIKFPISLSMQKVTDNYSDKVEGFFFENGGHYVLDYENILESPRFFSNQDHINTLGAKEIADFLKNNLER